MYHSEIVLLFSSTFEMYLASVNSAIFICLILSFQQLDEVQSNLLASRVKQKAAVQELCHYNTAGLAKRNGYLVEKHYIITDDGYILTTYRVNSKKPFIGPKKPMIMQHGIISSSDDFCINIPSQAPAYVFADAGYDIWLPNSRGSTYSQNHTVLSKWKSKFWDFSFTEIALHDLPATIDYVREKTGFDKVFYTGHSQGTTILMILLSEKPEYNQKVAFASLLAPVAYLGNSAHKLQAVSTIAPVLKAMKTGVFQKGPISALSGVGCSFDMMNMCSQLLDIVCGKSSHQRNETMMPAFMCHIPGGASAKQVMHFAQQVKQGFFGHYRDGKHPPKDFDLSPITAPISLHYSPSDTFTNVKDIKRLISELHSVVLVQEVNERDFGHFDFLWGINAAKNVYSKILDILKKY